MGDILDRVDDVDVAVLSTEALAKLMLGPPGTSIVCSFRRKDERYSTSSFLLRPQTCKSLCDDAVHSHFVRKTVCLDCARNLARHSRLCKLECRGHGTQFSVLLTRSFGNAHDEKPKLFHQPAPFSFPTPHIPRHVFVFLRAVGLSATFCTL